MNLPPFLGLLRFRVRCLLILVFLISLALWGETLRRRRKEYLAEAAWCGRLEQGFRESAKHDTDPALRVNIRYWSRAQARYLRAAAHPWESLEQDPTRYLPVPAADTPHR